MKTNIVLEVLGVVYSKVIRDLLVKAINDPDKTWDDTLIALLDRVFGYTGTE